MKNEKMNFSRIAMIAMSLILCFVLVSCGDSNDEESEFAPEDPKPVSNSIIGTWKYIWGEDVRSDYSAYTFFEDKTGIRFDKGNGAQRFTYAYNPDTKILGINWLHTGYKEEIIIKNITSNYIEFDGEKYNKSELTKNMLILGEWFLHVGNNLEKKTRIMFHYDGTYEAKDYDFDPYLLAENHYAFHALSGKVGGTYSISGNIISIKGASQISGDYIIDGLVVNGLRFIKKETPDAYPYIIGGYNDR